MTVIKPSETTPKTRQPRSLIQTAWRQFKRDKIALLGLMVLGLMILAVMIGPWIYDISPTEIDFVSSLSPPTGKHPFGTNDLGQDQLARLLIGGRVSLTVGVAAMAIAILLGTLVGAIAGFYGGIIDSLLMGLTDLFISLPQLPVLLLVIYLFRESIKQIVGPEVGIFLLIIIVVGGLNWMSVARLVRGSFLTTREQDFVTAAKAIGASSQRLIWVHILPNVLSPVIVAATLAVGTAIITESTLSFLGLGFPPDVPTWGRMLYDAQNYLETAPYLALFPGLAIFLTVLSINAVGDGLRDALDPQSH
ncbi:ABC transporter permease [Planktothrix paucivesiculata]|uniref:Oligopeptide transport system permease protein oppC (ABC superfamily, membrane) n=1 Tax=Planktothrix paucivesiculata PCC 9631 TaxID=671071 RepID=A0A7Z9BIB0_9CYAN|nr:ABC transporter permease [Planktothrix paucivesiculata]VXD14724.1 Putative oligopeptide transport system permease protein oppC (ABC superfamily, membrane) [Planktothrix paucivesiculata PCC 9631]